MTLDKGGASVRLDADTLARVDAIAASFSVRGTPGKRSTALRAIILIGLEAYEAERLEPTPPKKMGGAEVTPVDLSDPRARREWIGEVRAKVFDLVGVAQDAAKPGAERFFSRAEQRRRIAELERGLSGLLDKASGSLRPMAVVPVVAAAPSSSGAEEEGPPSTLRPI